MAKRAASVKSRAEQALRDPVDKPFHEVHSSISFSARPLRHADVLTVRNLSKSYGGLTIFTGVNITLGAGNRLAVLGRNGAGKSTLFKLLMGEEPSLGGEIRWSLDAVPMMLSQARTKLNLSLNAVEALGGDESRVRLLLGCLRVTRDAVFRPLGVLSVGERTKVEIASMLLSDANVLMLDEPTNHLDIDSLEALEEALMEFPGSIIFTSHDREFVDRLATDYLDLGNR
jgi:ATPase subunit of ABC transporter with duplicated ATPase domains